LKEAEAAEHMYGWTKGPTRHCKNGMIGLQKLLKRREDNNCFDAVDFDVNIIGYT